MGSFNGDIGFGASGHYQYNCFNAKVDFNYAQSIENNSSTITDITGYVKRNYTGARPYNSSKIATIKIERLDGSNNWIEVITLSNSSSYNINTNNYYAFVSKKDTDNIVIPHKDDGNQKIRITFAVDGKLSSYYPKGTISQEFDLTYIPRQATLTGASNFNDEQNPLINYSNPAGNTVTSLQACISWTGGADIKYRDIDKLGTSYTFELTDDERNALRSACSNSNSLSVTFYVTTVIGSQTYYSTLARTMTIVNANPTFSDFDYLDDSSINAITENSQILVANKSQLRVTILESKKMIAKKGSTAKKYVISIDGKNEVIDYANDNVTSLIGSISASGTRRLEVRAFDSRNNSTLVYKDITVIPYVNPNIYIDATRLNNFEEETTIKVKGTYSKVPIDGIDKNTILDVKYRIRETGSEWGDLTSMTFTIDNEKGEYACKDVYVNLDNTKSFEIEIQVTDAFDTYTSKKSVDIGKPLFFISDNLECIGVNCVPPPNATPGSIHFENGHKITPQDERRIWTFTSDTYNFPLSNEFNDYPITAILGVGRGVSLKNGKVVIGDDIQIIKISACLFLEAVQDISYIWAFVSKNGSTTDNPSAILGGGSYFNTMVFSERLMFVNKNDEIGINISNPSYQTRTPTVRGGWAHSYITIEIVK